MRKHALLLLTAGTLSFGQLAAVPANAQEPLPEADQLPPGLQSARVLPGWELPNGNRMVALELQLQPGWKTYWRSPGDAGVPAVFNWENTQNLAEARLHWPTPEVIDSGGLRTLGYHERLILPIEMVAVDADAPFSGHLRVDLGLCETICVPGHLSLELPQIGESSDPQIEAALASVPVPEGEIAHCKLSEIRDGMNVTAVVAVQPGDAQSAAALEYDAEGVWVSEPKISVADGQLMASADFIDETGKPFELDPAKVRLTLIDGTSGLEFEGCL